MPLCLYSLCLYVRMYVYSWGLRFYDTAIRRYKDAATQRYGITEVPRDLGINLLGWLRYYVVEWLGWAGGPHPTPLTLYSYIFYWRSLSLCVVVWPELGCGLGLGRWEGEEWGMRNEEWGYLIFGIWYLIFGMLCGRHMTTMTRAMTTMTRAMTRTMT